MAESNTRMLVNYRPGDECRVAVVRDGKLEEYDAEPTDQVSRVNNIYVGRVVNVEPAIQAAFIDFGIGESGFLHVSDLHPMYLPESGSSERVGKKTPRRERPPIQECLKKGQEVTVQVLKEGVGTKGPTLTSYLSIPGRFLVMMPHMDKVGVSRKVEEEDVRKKMRQILDQLELPDGFGFILRTAGLDRNKTELKRDLAYLQRLWKDMERRRKRGKRPRLLYSESDLMVRTLRDMLTPDIDQVVIDHPSALRRAARFMKIVSPRAQAKLMQHVGDHPLFHAYGIEQQILAMHAREVPLPSGGRLVIDETEALVAIDVNSGRSRGARDAETNAYKTNLEAADEICRQLRLRDLGGLVINDFIDMGSPRHRKEVEQRVRDNLKRDRAKSTILPISNFGILEMTRQRMRGSHERVHFAECPTCRGRGLLQRPTSVAADAIRELDALLVNQRVSRVEMVVSPRVGGALLSSGRRQLSALEIETGKSVEVRLSDAIPADRVNFYAYDESGADIDIDKLPKPKGQPETRQWTEEPEGQEWAIDLNEEAEAAHDKQAQMPAPEEPPLPGEEFDDDEGEQQQETGSGKKRRRRRRRRSKKSGDAPSQQQDQPQGEPQETDQPESDRQAAGAGDTAEPPAEETAAAARADGQPSEAAEASEAEEGADGEAPKKKKRRRRRRRRKPASATSEDGGSGSDEEQQEASSGSEQEAAAEARDGASNQPAPDAGSAGDPEQQADDGEAASESSKPAAKKKKRTRKSSIKPKAERDADAAAQKASGDDATDATDNGQPADAGTEAAGDATPTKKKTRRKSGKKSSKKSSASAESAGGDAAEGAASGSGGGGSKKTGSKKSGSGTSNSRKSTSKKTASGSGAGDKADAGSAGGGDEDHGGESGSDASSSGSKQPKPRRTLYATRRKLSPSERARGGDG